MNIYKGSVLLKQGFQDPSQSIDPVRKRLWPGPRQEIEINIDVSYKTGEKSMSLISQMWHSMKTLYICMALTIRC